MRKTLYLIICVALTMSQYIHAQDAHINGIYNNLDNAKHEAAVTYKSSDHYKKNVVIPDSIEYQGHTYTVTEIADSAFKHCDYLRTVEIPK